MTDALATLASKEIHESYPFIAPKKYKGKLNGKVTIVTGASSGIGAGLAKGFAAAGARVACIARREDKLKAVVDEVKAAGGEAIAIVGDVAKRGGPKEIVSQVESQLGPVDILINNAGITRLGLFWEEEEDVDIWWRVHEVNVRAPVAMCRAVLPSMMERKTGVLMTVSSAVATLTLPAMTAYSSSKAAISKFHEGLIQELDGTGVLSLAVHPGMVETEVANPVDAINKTSLEHPIVQGFMAYYTDPNLKRQTMELPVDTMVALAADERCKALQGLHINVTEDLEAVVKEAEREGRGRIGTDRLYLVTVPTL
ncbi:uncharacterized protein LTR77_006744 [Saxophila tyrrhenica]|uniref:NAD(P)-binding protein n=1 Tax=Saxophila tyrrhenica TaxID=1690608 RepID=A0AAV9P9R7_9PEZI|nr:hypothetical protein LTR77_006744 [Saxophila tyrrhenica]